MAHGVVDEVGDQPFEQYPVPGDLRILQLHLGSLGRYVQLGEQTSAQVTADADPAA